MLYTLISFEGISAFAFLLAPHMASDMIERYKFLQCAGLPNGTCHLQCLHASEKMQQKHTSESTWQLLYLYTDLIPGYCSQSHTIAEPGQQPRLSDLDTV